MSCFCVRGFGGRLGFLFFGGCSGLSAVFSRVRGSSGFLVFLPSCGLVVGGGGSGCWGFSRVRGWVRPVLLLLLVGGGLGASGASGSCVFVRGLGACAPGS